MALTIRTTTSTVVSDSVAGINITQQKQSDDVSDPGTLDLNFTQSTYLLAGSMTDWLKVDKGDITKIRDITLILTSTIEGTSNIEVLITGTVDPNTPTPEYRTMAVRDLFIGAVNLDGNKNLWIKNTGTNDATLITILGGTNL